MNQICKQCGIEYEAKRSDSKFCSSKCRVTFNRLVVTFVTDNPDSVTLTQGSVTDSPVTVTGGMTPEGWSDILPANYGEEDCACLHCQQNSGKKILDHGVYKDFSVLGENEMNRISLPGDVDYCGYMEVK